MVVEFTDLTVPSYNPIISWQWDFNNDGTVDSNEQNPIHIYNEIGVYTVSLTVSDGYSDDTEIKEDYIEVMETGVEHNIVSPETLLCKNYPNPFNPETIIEFSIKEGENGSLTIYNTKGQLLETYEYEAGNHELTWDAKQYGSGIYFYKLETQSYTETKKMIMLK